jgi:malate dehydrogenase (quinone)
VSKSEAATQTDVVLVGAGIMSATLAALIRLVEPDWSITLIERLDGAAAESSDPWNNAGTGHSALCELNYTPELPDGDIDIAKAVHVNEQFQVSRQFWSYAVENGVLPDVRTSASSAAPRTCSTCASGTTRWSPTRCSRRWSSSTTATSSPAGCR